MNCFASIAYDLTTLTHKSMKFEWSEECDKSFRFLKKSLTYTLVLTSPEGTKGFVVYCDISRVCLWSVPMQHRKVIAYAFRKL